MIAKSAACLGRAVVVPATLLLFAALPAEARIDPRGMSCAQATATVQEAGSVIMSTGPYTYANIVSSPAGCRASNAQRQLVPTRDNPRCAVGFVCLPRTSGDR